MTFPEELTDEDNTAREQMLKQGYIVPIADDQFLLTKRGVNLIVMLVRTTLKKER